MEKGLPGFLYETVQDKSNIQQETKEVEGHVEVIVEKVENTQSMHGS